MSLCSVCYSKNKEHTPWGVSFPYNIRALHTWLTSERRKKKTVGSIRGKEIRCRAPAAFLISREGAAAAIPGVV